MTNSLLEEIKRIRALADTGLLYAQNEYDKERYRELRAIGFRFLAAVSGHSPDELKTAFPLAKDYPTAKVDIRALVLSADKEILLVKESADGRWSLPGGWADVGHSPKEVAIKEVKEETGLDVTAERLLAVFDKRKHPHPPQPFYVYKMVFLCEATSFAIQKGFDVLDVQFFSVNNLPELSEDRILAAQIELLYDSVVRGKTACYFD